MAQDDDLRDRLLQVKLHSVHLRTDQLFFWLLLSQWVLAVALALLVSPRSWAGSISSTHVHVLIALVFGGVINALPFILIRTRPGTALTRHVVAVAQMAWSAVLIHLTGGRIESHFHVFGSLAFIAFYSDWRVLVTATSIVALDHLARGLFWPESVYGIANPEWWRFLEHAAWVIFEDIVLILGCQRLIMEMRIAADREVALEGMNAEIEQKVAQRTWELADSMRRYRALVENTNAIPWEYDPVAEELTYIAPQAARLFGCAPEELLSSGFLREFVHPGDRERVEERMRSFRGRTNANTLGDQFDHRMVAKDGRQLIVHTVLSPYQAGEPIRGIILDISRQKKLESDLNQAQKLESVGRLAAGVAHEINTPVQFVSDSIHFLKEATTDLLGVVTKLQSVRTSVMAGAPSVDAAAEAAEAEDAADLPYIVEHMPKALDRSLDGLGRVATIVRSMKEFAHPDSQEMTSIDLNRAIESTITIARNEYKYVADVETDFGELPPIICHAGDLNQAVLNILVNAAHAIGDVVKNSGEKGRIIVRTREDDGSVIITIADSGAGIPEEIRGQLFDPFFTTKEVGKGTGQGLAIARSVVVDKHQGEISLESEVGVGTTFYLRIPVGGHARVNEELEVAA